MAADVNGMCWCFTTWDPVCHRDNTICSHFNIQHIRLFRQSHDEHDSELPCYRSKGEAISALMNRIEHLVEKKKPRS